MDTQETLFDAYLTGMGEFAFLFPPTGTDHWHEKPALMINLEESETLSTDGINFGMLMQGITDLQWLRAATVVQIREKLTFVHDCGEALYLFCMTIDPELSDDLWLEAIEECEKMISDNLAIAEWLADSIKRTGRPEDGVADLDGAIARAGNQPKVLALLKTCRDLPPMSAKETPASPPFAL
jgi:hypothetical protein